MASFNGLMLFQNTMPLLSPEENLNSVSLPQLIVDNGTYPIKHECLQPNYYWILFLTYCKPPTHALFSSYVCEWEWLCTLLPPATHITVALNWNFTTGKCELPIGNPFKEGRAEVRVRV